MPTVWHGVSGHERGQGQLEYRDVGGRVNDFQRHQGAVVEVPFNDTR